MLTELVIHRGMASNSGLIAEAGKKAESLTKQEINDILRTGAEKLFNDEEGKCKCCLLSLTCFRFFKAPCTRGRLSALVLFRPPPPCAWLPPPYSYLVTLISLKSLSRFIWCSTYWIQVIIPVWIINFLALQLINVFCSRTTGGGRGFLGCLLRKHFFLVLV